MFKLSKTQIVWISGIMAGVSFVLKNMIGYAPLTIVLMLAVTVIAGTSIFNRAIGGLRYKVVGIDTLVSVAVLGALSIGEYWEAVRLPSCLLWEITWNPAPLKKPVLLSGP